MFTPQIVNPPKDLKKPRGKKCFFVKFFGTEDQYVSPHFSVWAKRLYLNFIAPQSSLLAY